MAGSAAGSAYLAGTRTLAQALGAAGLPGYISMKPSDYGNFTIGLILSMGVSFALTVFFWKRFGLGAQEEGEKRSGEPAQSAALAVESASEAAEVPAAPASGEGKTEAETETAGADLAADTGEKAPQAPTILCVPVKGEVLPV